MVLRENYNPFEIDLTFDLVEGNLEVKQVEQNFGKDTAWLFANPIEKGDFVTLTADTKTVKKAGPTDEIIGQVITHPAWSGNRPSADTPDGDYKRRVATIRLYGLYAQSVPIKATNAKIDVGNSVKYQGNNEFDKIGTKNDTRVLENVPANAGGTVFVLFKGYDF